MTKVYSTCFLETVSVKFFVFYGLTKFLETKGCGLFFKGDCSSMLDF